MLPERIKEIVTDLEKKCIGKMTRNALAISLIRGVSNRKTGREGFKLCSFSFTSLKNLGNMNENPLSFIGEMKVRSDTE